MDEHHRERVKHAAEEGRKIQKAADRKEKSARPKAVAGPMQAGERHYPAKFPAQHLEKPGREQDLRKAPMFEAPAYMGSGKLQDMSALVTEPGCQLFYGFTGERSMASSVYRARAN